MSDIRKAVIEDVLALILEEYGSETMALDWAILEAVVEDSQKLAEDSTE